MVRCPSGVISTSRCKVIQAIAKIYLRKETFFFWQLTSLKYLVIFSINAHYIYQSFGWSHTFKATYL